MVGCAYVIETDSDNLRRAAYALASIARSCDDAPMRSSVCSVTPAAYVMFLCAEANAGPI